MALDTILYLLGAASGGLVGFTLGLVGGGGSILAAPLVVCVVGMSQAPLKLTEKHRKKLAWHRANLFVAHAE